MPKFFSSIFFKLMVIILVPGLGINIAMIAFFGAFRHHVTASFHPHLNRYIDYVLEEIGDPPDRGRARRMAEETGMTITYEGSSQIWSTSKTPIKIPQDRLRILHSDSRMEAGRHRGNSYAVVKLNSGRLVFFLPSLPEAEKKIKVLSLGLLSFITLLLLGAYFGIRRVLKPLKGLKYGVKQVARGDLSHRVPLRRRDELRDLSDAFNTMTSRLQHLIKSKEQLLLDVSHELRTPVTRMKVSLAMMPESPGRDNLTEDLHEIEEKITELLETARTLNIKAALDFSDTDLPAMIRRTARPFELTRPSIHVSPMAENVIARIDGEQISRALKNILDNAQKYSPDNADPIQLSLEIAPEEFVIVVQDHGIGISETDLDFIFEPFYRADKARTPQSGGYGLGLSMARNIVEAHGGNITITSKVGQGTTVRIQLPIGTPPEGEDQAIGRDVGK